MKTKDGKKEQAKNSTNETGANKIKRSKGKKHFREERRVTNKKVHTGGRARVIWRGWRGGLTSKRGGWDRRNGQRRWGRFLCVYIGRGESSDKSVGFVKRSVMRK